MATDLTQLKERIVKRMRKRLGDHSGDLFKVARPIVDTRAYVDATDFDGGNNYTAQSGAAAPSASDVRAFKSSSNPTRYEIDVPLTEEQLLDWQRAADQVGDLLVDRAWHKITVDFWTLIFGARATAHPDNGVSGSPIAAVGGGTAYVVDNLEITPINGASAFQQTNDHTVALTATNLRTVLNKRPAWKDRDGGASATRADKPYLCVVPELAGTAKNLVMQSGQLYNGSGLSEGFADEIAGVIVVPREATAAADAWALVYVTETLGDNNEVTGKDGPLLIHLRAAPKVEVDREPGGGFYHCYCSFSCGIWFHPLCDRDLMYSEP